MRYAKKDPKNVHNEDIMIQGATYEPTTCVDDDSMNPGFDKTNLTMGSNPDGKYDPNAFYKIFDQMIEEGKLHTKEGKLIAKRVGPILYDKEGNII